MSQQNWQCFIPPQAGQIACVVGDPGVAKTTLWRTLAKKAGLDFIPVYLDRWIPEDVDGYRRVGKIRIGDERVEAMTKVLAEEIVRAYRGPSCIFFDEFNQCSHQMLGAAQEAMRKLSEAPNTWVVAAMNPPNIASAGEELTAPMVNRMVVVKWETPEETFLDGLQRDTGESLRIRYPIPEVPVLPEGWLGFRPVWGDLIRRFLSRRPELVQRPPTDPSKHGLPWPSPRSWEAVANCEAACDAVSADETVRDAIRRGCVGEGAAAEFSAFVATQDIPDPEEILKDPKGFEIPVRSDLAMAVSRSLVAAVETNRTPERWERLCDAWETIADRSEDIALAYFGKLWKIKPDGHNPQPRNGVFQKLHYLRNGAAV